MAPKLTSDKPNELLAGKGVADKILAEAEAKREYQDQHPPSPRKSGSPLHRSRSVSHSTEESVSTVSTDRSRSRSPHRHARRSPSLSRSPDRRTGRKRKYDSRSASSCSRSPPPAPGSHRKNRRHRTISPGDRGRPDYVRRGSRRSRSRSISHSPDRSQVARQRRSLESPESFSHRSSRASEMHRGERTLDRGHDRRPSRRNVAAVSGGWGSQRRERSLSPYSRRLALTQAMNMAR